MARKLHINFDDSQLYTFMAVVSHIPDYRFIYEVNQLMQMNFLRLSELPVYNEKDGKIIEYPLFYFDDEINRQEFFCIGCRSGGYSLLPELRQHDFLFIRLSEHKQFDVKNFSTKLRSIKDVIMTSVMPYTSMKQIQGILIDLEMHMTTLQKQEKEKNDPRMVRNVSQTNTDK